MFHIPSAEENIKMEMPPKKYKFIHFLQHLATMVEVVLKKISDYQVSEKIHSKAGAEENIIMEIPL